MRLLLLSDAHCEFHADKGRAFFESFRNFDDYDVAILAGDIADFKSMPQALAFAADNLKRATYVIGNHEGYGGSINDALVRASDICAKTSNLHHLDCESIVIDGVKIVGATGWFPHQHDNLMFEHHMNDFTLIRGFRDEVYIEHACTRAWLSDAIEPGCVVVTHYLPCAEAVHPKWRRSVLNRFFVSDFDGILRAKKPALWCFGHTHDSIDERVGETRIVANPFGYVGHELNPNFIERLVIEVPT